MENDSTPGIADVLSFGAGIASKQLWFNRVGNDLAVSVIGTADKAMVQNRYSGTAFHVEQIKAGDGKVLLDSGVEALVQAMAGFAPPVMGQVMRPRWRRCWGPAGIEAIGYLTEHGTRMDVRKKKRIPVDGGAAR